MRVSKPQQAKTRQSIIRAAVDLMPQQGFDGTTMKQIARAAGVGDATIYKYFPTKEKLVLAYFELAVTEALAQWRKTRGQEDFALQERLQLLMDSLLERLLADREFVALARGLVARAPLLMLGEELPGKALLKAAVAEMLAHAQERGEIAPCAVQAALSALLADGAFGVVAYWLHDQSEEFGNTTQLVDLGLAVLVLTLQSGLIDKLLALGGFLLRSQLSRLVQDGGGGLLDTLKRARRALHGGAL
jgi:TetR/AcrR family transcriptional regulator, regulator of autoinduction and epiphytic fitness